jgi:UDP-N-acetylglucosamine--N-acetylmuramyl-(pentapeptide) pyrophosphoryl-undecaprenol N-acetylglucosamine transferase
VNVIIAGGGTAGHVNPALALAERFPGDEVGFIGTTRGVEASLVPSAGHSFQTIEIEGFDRARPERLPLVAIRAMGAIIAARGLLKDRRPDIVVGMGGYVSLPVCLAAATARIPVVLHEQNIVLGLAHRTCKPVAKRVAVSFEDTLAQAGSKGVMTGNPVSKKVAELDVEAARPVGLQRFDLSGDRRTVLIFGGSLGALTINRAAAELATRWAGRDDVQILHITGRSPSTQATAPTGVDPAVYRSLPYTDAIEEAYAIADVAVCRGGASTIAELTAVGIPAVVVPYPFHRDRQQYRHGEVLEKVGAGVVVDDRVAGGATVDAALAGFLQPDGLARAKGAARSLGRRDAAERLAEVVRAAA